MDISLFLNWFTFLVEQLADVVIPIGLVKIAKVVRREWYESGIDLRFQSGWSKFFDI